MKKFIYILTLSLAAIVACNKEIDIPEHGNSTLKELTFTGITDDGLSKTSLGTDFSILWSTDDDITVFPGASAAGVKFDVSETAREGLEATFTGSASESEVYYALSPAQAGATIADGKITATLPTSQTATAGSYDPAANVSVSVAEDYVFQFKNVGALIAFTVGNDDVTKVRLEALGGEPLTGQVTVNTADGVIASRDDCESYAEMTGSFTNGSTYYFIVLPGIYDGGFSITLYKGYEYARFNKPASKGIGRNDSFDFGTITGTSWKTAFVVGENVKIKGSYEDGQDLAYVGSNDYWNSDITYSDVDGYEYNYEIFTRLTQDQKFYFRANGGEKFTLNAEGTAVEFLARTADAAYGAPEDGLYRIRMVLPEGAAEVKQITEVKYDIYGLDSRLMTYQGNGVWSSDNFHIRTSSYMNRYRFLVKFKDSSKQYYGRMVSNNGNPVYGQTEATYFHLQPTIDSDADHWSPCFQYPSVCQDVEGRYYCTMTLSLNNAAGHYTHSVTNVTDTQNPAVIFICGSNEAGQQMCFIASDHYNTSMDNYGDNASLVPTAISEYFEMFTRLNSGERFYFYNATNGKYYAPTSTGAGVEEISGPSDATYSISTGGAWRIRANFSTGAANIRRIDQVRTELNYDGGFTDGVHVLNYTGKGTWAKNTAAIKGHPGQFSRSLFTEYVIKIWFNRDNADNEINCWQVYGTTSVKSGSPASESDYSYWDLQPATGDNWSHVFFYPSWTIDTSGSRQYYATITVYMNDKFGNYTHRFSNVAYEDNIPE